MSNIPTVRADMPSLRICTNVSGPDAFWWLVDADNNPMVVNVLFQSDDVWTPKDVKETLQKPVEDNIRLRAYPKLSGLWWQWEEVQDFSLDNHIKLHVLSEPTDEALTKFIDDEVDFFTFPVVRCGFIGVTIRCLCHAYTKTPSKRRDGSRSHAHFGSKFVHACVLATEVQMLEND